MSENKKDKPKHWSKKLDEAGVRFRIYGHPESSMIWFSIMVDGPLDKDGKKTRVKRRRMWRRSKRRGRPWRVAAMPTPTSYWEDSPSEIPTVPTSSG